MNPAARLIRELGQLRRVLTSAHFGRYCLALAGSAPIVLGRRSLVPADRAMRGAMPFHVRGAEIRVPLDEMARLLEHHDQTPSFGGAREMYAANVYLGAFRPDLSADSVVDLGSNRGLFLLLGAKVLKARVLVGVEPEPVFTPVFAALADANGLPRDAYARYERLVGSAPGPSTMTVGEIMDAHALARIGFLKCDIEGGEFDVFLNDGSFLDRVDNIAMELHPSEGDVALIVDKLVRAGFACVTTDQFMRPVPPRGGHYLYASSKGDLILAQ